MKDAFRTARKLALNPRWIMSFFIDSDLVISCILRPFDIVHIVGRVSFISPGIVLNRNLSSNEASDCSMRFYRNIQAISMMPAYPVLMNACPSCSANLQR
jgi:hypothetical protein